MLFIFGCSLAINLLKHRLFKGFVEELDKTYIIPSPYILSTNILNQEYEIVMSNLKIEFARTDSEAVT